MRDVRSCRLGKRRYVGWLLGAMMILGVMVPDQATAQHKPLPALGSFCDDSDAWDGIGAFFSVVPKSTCTRSNEINAWSYLGKLWEQSPPPDGRAGLLARSDIDYCLLRAADGTQLDHSDTYGFFGRFGVGQQIHINAFDPAPQNRHIKGYRDLYIHVFGLKAPLNRQRFEVWFPRTSYPIQKPVNIPVLNPDPLDRGIGDFRAPGRVFRPGYLRIDGYSAFLLARALDGRKQTELDIPVIGKLFSINLLNGEFQDQMTDPKRMWDWVQYGSPLDALLEKNGVPAPLGQYGATDFPEPWVGKWQLGIPYVHLDYTQAKSRKGVQQRVDWQNGENFRAGGKFDSGGVVSVVTGGTSPDWIDDLLALMSVEIRSNLDFRPGSSLSIENYLRPPPVPLQDPDAPAVSIGDTTIEYTSLDAGASYEIAAELSITLTLNLIFISPSWTWNLVDVSLIKEEISGVIGNSMGEVHRKDQSDGTAFDYRQIGLIGKGTYHYAEDARHWIETCLAEPAVTGPEAPLERPVLTADTPTSPVACLVDAQCEADLPYFRLCICDDARGTNPRGCKDSTLLDDMQMAALIKALSRSGPICQP